MYDLRIINGVVYINNKYKNTNIYITDGIIKEITPDSFDALNTYDCNGDLVFPGIIDPHTHFELDLGHISSRDTFYTGTKAGALGGVTTIIDFLEPVNNSDALVEAFYKRKEQAKDSVIDYKFHACLKNPKNEVIPITVKMKHLGLNTVKIFTTYSDSNRRTYDPEIIQLLQHSVSGDYMVTAHIENDILIQTNKEDHYRDLPLNRPTISESSEAIKLAKYVKQTNGYLYMVHCSSGQTLKQLRHEFSDILNKNFIIESCPHYFMFNNEVLNREDGYLYTMAPPLRSEQERILLTQQIDDVFTIGTDHCSFNKKDKQVNKLCDMPLGVSGIGESFDIMFSIFGDTIIDKMTKNVAIAHKLYPQKGTIQIGSDADLFIYHLEDTKLNTLKGNTDYSIYQDIMVRGTVSSTLSRGNFIVKNGLFLGGKGRLLNKCGDYCESD